VKFPSPPQPRTPFVVVARNTRTGQMVLLEKTDHDRYEGSLTIDKRAPRDDQIVAVLAYAEQDDAPGRNRRTEAAIERAGLWNTERPYIYNPLIVVSRNRAESALTVVEPSRRRARADRLIERCDSPTGMLHIAACTTWAQAAWSA